MVVLIPALKILGIALASEIVGRLMEERGHGGKVIFIKIIAHVGCAYIALGLLQSALRHFVHLLGVLG